jgi:methenyltetrahydrofolate cyclohydrolase
VGRHDLREASFAAVLEALSAPGAPGGGSAAALTAAMSAALVAMTSSASEADWPDGPGIAAQALRLRSRLAELAELDAEAFATSLEALAGRGQGGDERRDFALRAALERAAEAPLAVAEAACDVALLAAAAAEHVRLDLQADAVVAGKLAAAAAESAAHLVEVNLATTSGDDRVTRARAAAESAAAAVPGTAGADSVQSPR